MCYMCPGGYDDGEPLPPRRLKDMSRYEILEEATLWLVGALMTFAFLFGPILWVLLSD